MFIELVIGILIKLTLINLQTRRRTENWRTKSNLILIKTEMSENLTGLAHTLICSTFRQLEMKRFELLSHQLD